VRGKVGWVDGWVGVGGNMAIAGNV